MVDGCDRVWSVHVGKLHVRRCQVCSSLCVNIPEYLYSFSLGSCDWRMYTMIAAVLTVLW